MADVAKLVITVIVQNAKMIILFAPNVQANMESFMIIGSGARAVNLAKI